MLNNMKIKLSEKIVHFLYSSQVTCLALRKQFLNNFILGGGWPVSLFIGFS